jgi:hypothetical protein
MSKSENQTNPALKKVRGWLLILCINLIVVNPLWQIKYLVEFDNTIESMNTFGVAEGLEELFYFSLLFDSLIIFYSIRTGLGLVNFKTGALQSARNFLRNYAIYILLLLPFTAIMAPAYFEICSDILLKGAFESLIILGIGYAYLTYSKKVKAIYLV